MRNVGLYYTGGPRLEQLTVSMDPCQPFSRGDRCLYRTLYQSDVIYIFWPAGFFKKVEPVRFKRLREHQPHAGCWPGMAIDHNIDFVTYGFPHCFYTCFSIMDWL